jgi:hypothetical protein
MNKIGNPQRMVGLNSILMGLLRKNQDEQMLEVS